MNGWEAELGRRHSFTGGVGMDVSSMPSDAFFPGADNDALLEALVFMDDLDIDSTDALSLEPGCALAAAHSEPHPQVFNEHYAQIDHGIPAAAYMAGSHTAASGELLIPTDTTLSTTLVTHDSPPTSERLSGSQPISPAASTDSSAPSSNGTVKGVVNRSRNRRREELQYLRGMVDELEGRLTTLHTRAKEQQEQESKKSIENERADDPVLTAVWEDLAVRQYAQRQRAEVENVKLRRMLEDQIQVGKSLERLLKKRSNTGDTDLHLGGKRPRRSSLSIAWNDAGIFDELVQANSLQYLETERVLSSVNFDRGTASFRDIQVKNDPETGVMLEVVEANILPFDYELTVQEMFTVFMDRSEHDRVHYHDAKVEDELLKVQFGLTVQIPRAKGEFNLKIVSRRYREATRTVFVWTAFCDPKDVSDTNMDGIYMRHRGWTIVEPLVPVGSSSTTGASPSSKHYVGTRTRSYSMAIPETFADVPDQKRKVGTLTNFMLATTDVQLSSRLQLLENRLVELSRHRTLTE